MASIQEVKAELSDISSHVGDASGAIEQARSETEEHIGHLQQVMEGSSNSEYQAQIGQLQKVQELLTEAGQLLSQIPDGINNIAAQL